MAQKLNLICEDSVRVSLVDDLIEYFNNRYKKTYFYSPIIEIEYPSRTRLLPVFSIYDNVKSIEILSDEPNPESMIVYFKNGNKETILNNEYEEGKVIFGKALMENKDLIQVDTLWPVKEKPTNYFFTTINRKIDVILPDIGCESNKQEEYKNIRYIVGSIPNKVIDIEKTPFSQRIKQNDQVRFKIGDEDDDFTNFDEAFYQNRKIRILDKNIYTIGDLVFLKTGNNNLIILSKDYEY